MILVHYFGILPEQLDELPLPEPLNVLFALGNLTFHLPLGFLFGQFGVQHGHSVLGIKEKNTPEIIVLLTHHPLPFKEK
jgi:hypothetical protein